MAQSRTRYVGMDVHLRAGDRTPVAVPAVQDTAVRDLSRARDEPLSELNLVMCRLTACLLQHAIRDTGRATWGPALLRWLGTLTHCRA